MFMRFVHPVKIVPEVTETTLEEMAGEPFNPEDTYYYVREFEFPYPPSIGMTIVHERNPFKIADIVYDAGSQRYEVLGALMIIDNDDIQDVHNLLTRLGFVRDANNSDIIADLIANGGEDEDDLAQDGPNHPFPI